MAAASADNPLRLTFVVAVTLFCFWLVATKSLPFALAPTSPDAALALNSNNPAALMVKAGELEAKLATITGAIRENKEGGLVTRDGRSNTISELPAAQDNDDEPQGEWENLNGQIQRLAIRTLVNDPLNARAMRMLGEATNDQDQARFLMQRAFEQSRQEAIALFWLLNDSYHRKDFKSTLLYAEILIRTRPLIATASVYPYLSAMASEPKGRKYLVDRLNKHPVWRATFFDVLPSFAKDQDAPFLIMTALKDAGNPPSDKELAPYLNFLVAKKRVDAAYNDWLQLQPESNLENLDLLTNGNFENKPSGVPFDWKIERGTNAIVDFVPLGRTGKANAFHVKFGDGRVAFPKLSQVLFLPTGQYRLEGKLRGDVSGPRGLRWQILCVNSNRILAETEMFLGKSENWRIFTLDAQIPASSKCSGEILQLIHDSRSTSEELISGEVWFSDLRLTRLHPVAQAWAPIQ